MLSPVINPGQRPSTLTPVPTERDGPRHVILWPLLDGVSLNDRMRESFRAAGNRRLMITTDEASVRLSEAESAGRISAAAAENIRRWLSEPPFRKYRERLAKDIDEGRWAELDDAFFAVLEFGTGGRRGKMYPVGTNVLNERTMAESARGLADYVTARKGADAPRTCVVARDTRHHSAEFAELCARVLAAAGFQVFLFKDHRSTPLLSFAVRHLHCDAGIMITASHNPPSDNGFKCYSSTGGQVIPPDDDGIIECVAAASDREIPEKPLEEGLADGSIVWADSEVDAAYIAAVVSESVSHARDLSIVYTPLHGVGETSVAAVLDDRGLQASPHPRIAAHARRRLPQRARPRLQPRVSQDARGRDRRGPRHRRGSRAGQRPGRRPDRRAAFPSPAIPAASGRRSTATRSASSWRRS